MLSIDFCVPYIYAGNYLIDWTSPESNADEWAWSNGEWTGSVSKSPVHWTSALVNEPIADQIGTHAFKPLHLSNYFT
jgi:hypothetical protein